MIAKIILMKNYLWFINFLLICAIVIGCSDDDHFCDPPPNTESNELIPDSAIIDVYYGASGYLNGEYVEFQTAYYDPAHHLLFFTHYKWLENIQWTGRRYLGFSNILTERINDTLRMNDGNFLDEYPYVRYIPIYLDGDATAECYIPPENGAWLILKEYHPAQSTLIGEAHGDFILNTDDCPPPFIENAPDTFKLRDFHFSAYIRN